MHATAVAAAALLSAAPSSVEQQKQLAKKEIERFEGKGESALAAELFGKKYQLHFGGNPVMDLAAHQGVLAMFHTAFPDLEISVLTQVGQGDKVANHFVMKGTHQGAFQGLAPTGKRFVTTGTNLMRFEGGVIAELWGQIDMVSVMQQLGAMPSDGRPVTEPTPQAPGKLVPGAVDAVKRFATGFNAFSPPTLAKEFGDDYVLDFPGGPMGKGVEGIKQATTEFITAFPDVHFATEDLLTEGDRVVWRWTMKGTQKGQLGPIPASGKSAVLTGISLFTLRDGKIVSDKVRADMMGLYAQLGALGKPDAGK